MNAIILGCGLIAARWIRALHADPRVAITALADPDHGAAEATAGLCGLNEVPIFADLATALCQAGADVAVNLTPADMHALSSRAALRHGLHVLTEKPLALTLDDAIQLTRDARERQLTLSVMSNRARDARFLSFRDLIHAVGPGPYTVTEDMFVHLRAPGFRDRLAYPALHDLAIHGFEQIRQIVSAAPCSITATEMPLRDADPHHSIATATVRFADGSVFTFRGGFSGPDQKTSPDGHWRAQLAGACCQWSGQDTATTRYRSSARPASTVSLPPAEGHGPRIAEMIDAMHEHRTVPDALTPIAMLDAAQRSARSGQPAAVRTP
jgi:predicted dehydrogenase